MQALIEGAQAAEQAYAAAIDAVRPEHRVSATNLVHYVWLRGHDVRELQAELADLGLSSLGRLEARVMPTLLALASALDRMSGEKGPGVGQHHMIFGPNLLDRNAENLLGPQPKDRASRIMVTFPSEAATDLGLVKAMVNAGTDIARINCAHDGPVAWEAMIRNIREADPVKDRLPRRQIDDEPSDSPSRKLIAMDLAGPKVRTGPINEGPQVVKVRPQRDEIGRTVVPAEITLCRFPAHAPTRNSADIPVMSVAWLRDRKPGERIRFVDSRHSERFLTVREVGERHGWPFAVAEMRRTAYFVPGITLHAADGSVDVGPLPATERHHFIRSGEQIHLTRSLEPHDPIPGGPHKIGCTLSQVFDDVQRGDKVWFDDGKIGGEVITVEPSKVVIDVFQAGVDGVKLRAEKGINLPDTHLDIPALTEEDLTALPFVVKHADIVNYSFVRTPQDVRDLLDRVRALGRTNLDVILKIENVEAFRNLPQILLEAMKWRDIGVMIARGDLAVEAGFDRLAEVQEEILWICEAAHVPVVWATQVLESLAKTGLPSRAEVTDAAMSERAECVMLNKGPFIVEAIRFLHDVLWRMRNHVDKKRNLLRRLRAWDLRKDAH